MATLKFVLLPVVMVAVPESTAAVEAALTVIVPVALTLPQPPVSGML